MRGRGGFLGFNRDTNNREYSGIWRLDEAYSLAKDGYWSDNLDRWNYSPMQDWYTTGSPNSWATNTSTVLAQNTSYGPQARARSNSAQKALNGNWTLEFSFNKTGLNSSPYPGQHLVIATSNSLSNHSNSTTGKFLWLTLGNNYGLYFTCYKGSDTQAFQDTSSRNNSTYGVAGYWHKVTFDVSSRTLSWYSSTSTSKDDYSSAITYTYSQSDFDSLGDPATSDFYIHVSGRGGTDGVRNVNWEAT